MDRLSDLPPVETIKSPEEEEILSQFFDPNTLKEPEKIVSSRKIKWKQFFCILGAFIIVYSGILDFLIYKIPNCGNATCSLILKMLIFTVCLFIILYYIN